MTADKDVPIDKTMACSNSIHRFCTQYFLDGYWFPEKLEVASGNFVNYFNRHRVIEALDNLIPADVYYGRSAFILDQRALTKERRLKMRKQ